MGGGVGVGAVAGLPKKSTRSRVSMAPRVSGGGGGSGSLLQDSNASGVTPVKAGTPAAKALSRRGNSRKSVGPGIPIPMGSESSSKLRQSLAPGLMRTDPRPISDKAFINASIKRLANYLFSSGYDQSNVSPKSLSRPSSKDFMNIITFLIRKIDTTFNDPSINGPGVKFEDEVTSTFRNLRYPLNVSKTALAAVGSPHTWPALLAALAWLIELLGCDEAAPQLEEHITQGDLDLALSEDGGQDTNASTTITGPVLGISQLDEITKRGEKSFTQFVIQSYEFFLNGDDSQIEQCEDQLVEAFELDNMVVSREKERLEELNIGLIEAATGQANPGEA
jgi:kinetochore protein NDC80